MSRLSLKGFLFCMCLFGIDRANAAISCQAPDIQDQAKVVLFVDHQTYSNLNQGKPSLNLVDQFQKNLLDHRKLGSHLCVLAEADINAELIKQTFFQLAQKEVRKVIFIGKIPRPEIELKYNPVDYYNHIVQAFLSLTTEIQSYYYYLDFKSKYRMKNRSSGSWSSHPTFECESCTNESILNNSREFRFSVIKSTNYKENDRIADLTRFFNKSNMSYNEPQKLQYEKSMIVLRDADKHGALEPINEKGKYGRNRFLKNRKNKKETSLKNHLFGYCSQANELAYCTNQPRTVEEMDSTSEKLYKDMFQKKGEVGVVNAHGLSNQSGCVKSSDNLSGGCRFCLNISCSTGLGFAMDMLNAKGSTRLAVIAGLAPIIASSFMSSALAFIGIVPMTAGEFHAHFNNEITMTLYGDSEIELAAKKRTPTERAQKLLSVLKGFSNVKRYVDGNLFSRAYEFFVTEKKVISSQEFYKFLTETIRSEKAKSTKSYAVLSAIKALTIHFMDTMPQDIIDDVRAGLLKELFEGYDNANKKLDARYFYRFMTVYHVLRLWVTHPKTATDSFFKEFLEHFEDVDTYDYSKWDYTPSSPLHAYVDVIARGGSKSEIMIPRLLRLLGYRDVSAIVKASILIGLCKIGNKQKGFPEVLSSAKEIFSNTLERQSTVFDGYAASLACFAQSGLFDPNQFIPMLKTATDFDRKNAIVKHGLMPFPGKIPNLFQTIINRLKTKDQSFDHWTARSYRSSLSELIMRVTKVSNMSSTNFQLHFQTLPKTRQSLLLDYLNVASEPIQQHFAWDYVHTLTNSKSNIWDRYKSIRELSELAYMTPEVLTAIEEVIHIVFKDKELARDINIQGLRQVHSFLKNKGKLLPKKQSK